MVNGFVQKNLESHKSEERQKSQEKTGGPRKTKEVLRDQNLDSKGSKAFKISRLKQRSEANFKVVRR